MTTSSGRRLVVPDDVLTQVVGDEMVLLHAGTGVYYGLDPVGASIFQAVTATESIATACDMLLARYDVCADQLRRDVDTLVEKLTGLGLLDWED